MHNTPGDGLQDLLRRHQVMARFRWFAAVFALFQVLTYAPRWPAGMFEAALAVAIGVGVLNVGFEIQRRRVTTVRAATDLAVFGLTADVLLASAMAWVFAFDQVSAVFAILILVPIEGALYFQLRGACASWAAVGVLYLGREWFGTRYGNPWEWPSVTFRVGIIGIVAVIVGTITRDLVRQRQEVLAALEDLQRADAWRQRLLAMLAHDVRAPLATIHTSFTTILRSRDRLSPAVVDGLAQAGLRQADRALLLARDLLDMARMEDGSLRLQVAQTPLQPVVERVRGLLPSQAKSLVVDVPADLAAEIDASRMEQVLYNLLANAYTHGQEPVEVRATSTSDAVEITVRDHGRGVKDVDRLFEPFAGSGEESVGLGVWTSRQLVLAHGGTLTYADAQPGASFCVRVPIVAPVASADEADDRRDGDELSNEVHSLRS